MNEVSTQFISVRFQDQIGWIEFNRPNEANVIDSETGKQLLEAAIACEQNEEVRLVVLSGKGKFYCAGGDLNAIYGSAQGMPAELRRITSFTHEAISVFARMRKPLLTAVNGPAAGAGFSLAVNSDFVIASEQASFRVAFTALGLSPDCATTFILPKLVGLRCAQDLILTNRVVSAEEALHIGLVSRVVARDQFEEEVLRVTREIADKPTLAFGSVRQLLLESYHNPIEQQMLREAISLSDLGGRGDCQEGVSAFLDKRQPDFSGN